MNLEDIDPVEELREYVARGISTQADATVVPRARGQ
jgi:hypothetical protein